MAGIKVRILGQLLRTLCFRNIIKIAEEETTKSERTNIKHNQQNDKKGNAVNIQDYFS